MLCKLQRLRSSKINIDKNDVNSYTNTDSTIGYNAVPILLFSISELLIIFSKQLAASNCTDASALAKNF